jgi:aminoglycoside phosphotransferase
MVHGDFCDTNVMVHGDEFQVIDIDWAGTLGEANYPVFVNKGMDLEWPLDMEDGSPILAKHDIWMLSYMFK